MQTICQGPECQQIITSQPGHRPRKYCSAVCKQRAYRKQKAAQWELHREQFYKEVAEVVARLDAQYKAKYQQEEQAANTDDDFSQGV